MPGLARRVAREEFVILLDRLPPPLAVLAPQKVGHAVQGRPTQVLPTVQCTAAATVTARAVYGIAATWRAQVAVTRRRAVTTRPQAAAGGLCRARAATSAFAGVSAVVQS